MLLPLCLIDTVSGEVMEGSRVRTTPEAFLRRFVSEQPPMRIAIERGCNPLTLGQQGARGVWP